jgi:hypothetical protein
LEKVKSIEKRLREYKNDAEAFLSGIVQTLEAEVRSKFQTKRRKADAQRATPVEVPFDEAFVKYLWMDDRVLKIVDVSLTSTEKASSEALQQSVAAEDDEAQEEDVSAGQA